MSDIESGIVVTAERMTEQQAREACLVKLFEHLTPKPTAEGQYET
jgi:hypothetical protein